MSFSPDKLNMDGGLPETRERPVSESAPEQILDTPYRPYIEEARREGKWVVLHDRVGNVPEGRVRLFRGVAPVAIKNEFGAPITGAEKGELADIARDIRVKSLSPERQERFEGLMDSADRSAPKFYGNDYSHIRDERGENGVVYCLDAEKKEATPWMVTGEGTKYEVSFKVPNDVSRERAQVFAVGKEAPLDVDIRPVT